MAGGHRYKGSFFLLRTYNLNKKFFPQTVYCWGSILGKIELATLTSRAPELCGRAL